MNPADNQNSFSPSQDPSTAPVENNPVGFPNQSDGQTISQPSDNVNSAFEAPTAPPPAQEPLPGSAIGGFQQESSMAPSTSAPGAALDPNLGAEQPQSADTMTTPPPTNGGGNKKKILAGLVVVMMVFGIGAGVFAMRQQIGTTSAWDCSKYNFFVDRDGTVRVQNESSRQEPLQKADIYINGTLVSTLDVPALSPGNGATLGTVSVPSTEGFTWRVDGTADCEDSGNYGAQTTATCSAVIAYDENWNVLNSAALSALTQGDVVRFAVSGNTNSGSFDKARFSINGGSPIESADKKPGSEEFYYEYTIPAGEVNFNVTAEIHHLDLGWF